MGRRKIEIKEVQNVRARNATFKKRKTGIFKKAHELSVLTGNPTYVFIKDKASDRLWGFLSSEDDFSPNYSNLLKADRWGSQDFIAKGLAGKASVERSPVREVTGKERIDELPALDDFDISMIEDPKPYHSKGQYWHADPQGFTEDSITLEKREGITGMYPVQTIPGPNHTEELIPFNHFDYSLMEQSWDTTLNPQSYSLPLFEFDKIPPLPEPTIEDTFMAHEDGLSSFIPFPNIQPHDMFPTAPSQLLLFNQQ